HAALRVDRPPDHDDDSRHLAGFAHGPPGSAWRGQGCSPTGGGGGARACLRWAPSYYTPGPDDLGCAASVGGWGPAARTAGSATACPLRVQARLDPGGGLCVITQEGSVSKVEMDMFTLPVQRHSG